MRLTCVEICGRFTLVSDNLSRQKLATDEIFMTIFERDIRVGAACISTLFLRSVIARRALSRVNIRDE